MKTHAIKARALALVLCAAMTVSTFPFIAQAAGEPGTTIHTYAATGDDPTTADNESTDLLSDKYTLQADGTSIPVVQYNQKGHNFDVARFSSDTRSPEFTLTVNEEINSVRVYPERYYPQENLRVSADKHTLTFTMSETANLNSVIVMINGDATNAAGQPYLAIINDPLEQDQPDKSASNVLNFKTFAEQYLEEHPNSEAQKPVEAGSATITLAKGTNKETSYTYQNTAGNLVPASDVNVRYPNQRTMSAEDVSYAFQAALDEIYQEGSPYDTLYFPSGTYTYAGLDIRNRSGKPVNIYLEEGALLKNRVQSCSEAMEPAIGIWDSADITISGRGMFDGNGVENYWKQNGNRSGDRNDAYMSCHQAGVMVVHSNNITFNDTYMRNAKQWNWEAHSGKNIALNNIKGLTPYAMSWGDGTDMASSQNLTINGAFTLGNDDCFASGHYNPSRWFAPEKPDLYSKEFGLSSFKPVENDPADEKFQKFSNAVVAYDLYNGDNDEWDNADTSDIKVKNTLQWSCAAGNGIRLGHEAHGYQLKSYTFENFNALGFQGGGHGITVQNHTDIYPRYESLTFKNCSFDTSRSGNNFVINGGDGGSQRAVGKDKDLRGDTDGYTEQWINKDPIANVVMEDCWFSKKSAKCSVSNATNLTIKNLYIGGKKVQATTDFNFAMSNVANADLDFAANTLPSFTSPESDSFTVADGEKLEFQVAATDKEEPDAVRLSLDETTLPEGAAYDAETGKFSWVPSQDNVGQTYEVAFTASDSYSSVKKTIQITVRSSQVTTENIVATEDASMHTWKTEKGQNKNLDYLRLLLASDAKNNPAAYGFLGEVKTAKDDTDQKMSLLKFDVSGLKEKVDQLDKAELVLTYMGRRNSSNNGDDSIRAAVVPDSAWSEETLTWNSRPAFTTTAETIKESAPFNVVGDKNIIMAQDDKYNSRQAIDGRKITIDVTDFIKALADNQHTLTLAINDIAGYEITVVSSEGAANNANATPDMAPTLSVSLKSAPAIDGPSTMTLTEGYGSASSEALLISGYRPVTVTKTSGDEKITWNSKTNKLDIAAGLSKGSYPVTLTASNGFGEDAVYTFTLTVEEAQVVNKDTLNLFIAKAQSFVDDGTVNGLVASAKKVYLATLAKAKEVAGNENATYAEVVDIQTKLLVCIHSVSLQAGDKQALGMLLASCDNLTDEMLAANYVEAGQAEYKAALAAAKAVYADGDAFQGDVDKAHSDLSAAVLALRMKADKSALQALLNQVGGINLSLHTEASAAVFTAALANANSVLANEALSVDDQAAVDEAVKTLQAAVDGLELKQPAETPETPADPTGSNNSGSSSKPDSGKPSGTTSKPSAQTGDASPIAGAAVLALAAGAAVVLIKRRKQ